MKVASLAVIRSGSPIYAFEDTMATLIAVPIFCRLCLGHRFGAVAAPCGLRASAFSRLLPQDELGSPSRKCSPCLGSSAPRALRDVCPERHSGAEKGDQKCTQIEFHS